MSWRVELAEAARRNYEVDLGVMSLSARSAWWQRFPYSFRPYQRIVSRRGCILRNYGACGDAAADLAALAVRLGHLDADVCIEAPPGMPDYAHARVIVGAAIYDPYASRRPPGLPASCAFFFAARDLVTGASPEVAVT